MGDDIACDFGEPQFDLIQPGTVGDLRGLMGRQIVRNDVHVPPAGLGGDPLPEKRHELVAGMARRGLAQDGPGLSVERRIEGQRAVTDIFEAMALSALEVSWQC